MGQGLLLEACGSALAKWAHLHTNFFVGHFPNLSPEDAHQLMEDAHQACPYSKATRGNIEVLLSAN